MVFAPSGTVPGDLVIWIQAHPGRTWILGNEPDQKGQANMCPEHFAEGYHDYYRTIVDNDGLARIAIGGISQEPSIATCSSASYTWQTYITTTLEYYLDTYGTVMPIDIWTIHRYPIFYENQPDLTLKRWKHGGDGHGPGVVDMVNFIRGLDVNGDEVKEYADTPIWLTEYGALGLKAHEHYYDYTLFDRFMIDASNWLESYGEIERWFWFAGASGHTAKRCWKEPWSWSGYLIEQREWDSGELTASGGSTTTLQCPRTDCGVPGVDWDRYSILYVKFDEDGPEFRRRVGDFDPNTGTLTVCVPFTATVGITTSFQVVRQVPVFVGGHLTRTHLGDVYYELAIGKR